MGKLDFNDKFEVLVNDFNNAFYSYLNGLKSIPEPLLSAMKYSCECGGKRLRPVLLLSANELFCGKEAIAMNFAIALELIHTYSLIHDDLPCMDNDDLRRGKPTNHKVFGEGQAVLAGDALLNLAYELMIETTLQSGKIEQCLNAMKFVSESIGSKGMIGGQCLDIKYETVNDITIEQLKELHSNKTGKLINASFLVGGILNSVSDETLEFMLEYSNNLGLAFQVVDDILDVVGDISEIGKRTGSDIIQNKHTYAKHYDISHCKEIADEYVDLSLCALDKIQAETEFLKKLAKYVVERKK